LALLGLLVFGIFTIQLKAANEISFQANAPKVVRAGEQFQLEYVLTESVDDFTPPDFGEFRYLGGPSTGSSTSVNFINGKTTRSSQYTFTYYIQAPASAGTYTLAPATASYRRNTIESNTIKIEVVGATAQTNPSSGNPSGAAGSGSQSGGDDVFVRLEFNKTTAYVGEQLTAQIKIYTQSSLSGIDPQWKEPVFSGFYRQDVEIPPLTSLEPEKVGDDMYYTGVLRKVILYPQKNGEIRIDPFDLLVEVQTQQRRRSQSLLDDFFGPQFQRRRINLKSKPVTLKINPLPGNQPDDFGGAVGQFRMTSSVNMNQAHTNDAITFKVTLSGTGNIKLIDKLTTSFPPAFDVFDPVKKVNLEAANEGRSGSVTFEYTAIPRHAGDFEVPPFSFSYFDIQSQSYKTLQSQSFSIQVAKSAGDTTTVVSSNLSKEDVELLGSDIRFIKSTTRLHRADYYIFGQPYFYAVYLLSLLLLLALVLIRREHIRRSADKVKLRNRKAAKTAQKRLKLAQKYLKANQKQEFMNELERALWMYLADKLNIPLSELSKDTVHSVLVGKGIPEESRTNFINLIDTCQYSRYAPGGMEGAMEDLYRKAQDVFIKIDQSL